MPRKATETRGQAWLVKQEPGDFPFSRLVKEKRAVWDGVRNYEARNNLRAMRRGDLVLYYHSGGEKAAVGVARVTKEAYPDPSSDDPRWVAVDLAPVGALARPVPLDEVKRDATLKTSALVTRGRLSVVPLSGGEFARFLALGRTSL